MVSSVLSPEKVIGRQNTNKAAAQNFISGGSVVGASVINGAANKIVGFQRTGAQPAPSATGSIVSTISTNINNNVTNTINKTLQGFSADYQNRIKQVDDAKPIGILGKFLNVYKTALGFINFFGNKRNIDNVRNNLDALKKSFTESFEVAKLIRQVIIKIVKQLSNLPVASPSGGGGLNLDVDIPGGGLKKSAPRGLGRMMGGKGKMLALGAGALGLGAAGAGAVNALSDSPQAQAAGTSPEIPGDIGDRFSSIVDRFANVVSKLFNMKNEKSKGSAASGGGGQTSGGPGGGGGGPGGGGPGKGVNAGDITADTAEEKAFIATVREAEGTAGAQGYNTFFGGSQYGGDLSQKTVSEVAELQKKFESEGKGKFYNQSKGKWDSSAAVGAGQFLWPAEVVEKMGMDPAKVKFTPELQNQMILYLAKKKRGVDVSKELTAADFKILGQEWAGLSEYYGQGGSLGKTAKLYEQNLKEARTQTKAKPGVGGPNLPDYMLPPEKRNQYKNLATNVSQPPPSQQQQQPVVMPINLGGGGQQQSGGGSSGGGGGGSQGSGPSVPFLPAGNPDNFLVLYSRMVYNIVDG
jgi:uncharacterized membrane protein YgcG